MTKRRPIKRPNELHAAIGRLSDAGLVALDIGMLELDGELPVKSLAWRGVQSIRKAVLAELKDRVGSGRRVIAKERP